MFWILSFHFFHSEIEFNGSTRKTTQFKSRISFLTVANTTIYALIVQVIYENETYRVHCIGIPNAN